MDDLLEFAIEAHGGFERWRQFNEVRANVSITGALFRFLPRRFRHSSVAAFIAPPESPSNISIMQSVTCCVE
jgi:hypothetical protein